MSHIGSISVKRAHSGAPCLALRLRHRRPFLASFPYLLSFRSIYSNLLPYSFPDSLRRLSLRLLLLLLLLHLLLHFPSPPKLYLFPMFLTEKAAAPLTLRFFSSKNSLPSSFPSLPFDQALIAGLHSLLPIPNSSSSIPLPWLCRAVDFLVLILSDAAALISDPSFSGSDRAALAAYLDSGIALLDACNAVAAHIDLLLRRHLLLRFALHLLSSPDSLCRARDAIAEWDRDRPPRRAIYDTANMLVRSLAPGNPPRGNLSAVRRVIYAMEAVSSLVAGAVIAVLGGGEKGDFAGITVSSEFPWAEAFNKVAEAVSSRLGVGLAGEVEAVEASVRRLAVVIDGEDGGEKTETLRSAVKDAEKVAEEMKDGLDRLSNAVNRLSRAALRTRNAVLQGFRIALQKCK